MTTPKRSNEEIVEEIWTIGNRLTSSEKERKAEILVILTEKDAEVEKARKTWLREEIVKLEEKFRKFPEAIGDAVDTTCLGYEQEAYNSALQTIIDRYQAELDQDVTHNP